jgi:hypothetical protein
LAAAGGYYSTNPLPCLRVPPTSTLVLSCIYVCAILKFKDTESVVRYSVSVNSDSLLLALEKERTRNHTTGTPHAIFCTPLFRVQNELQSLKQRIPVTSSSFGLEARFYGYFHGCSKHTEMA